MRDPIIEVKIQQLRRERRWLIGTGCPLGAVLLLLTYSQGGAWATILGLCSGFVVCKTFEMIFTHEPLLDDPQ